MTFSSHFTNYVKNLRLWVAWERLSSGLAHLSIGTIGKFAWRSSGETEVHIVKSHRDPRLPDAVAQEANDITNVYNLHFTKSFMFIAILGSYFNK
jgi:hypothetical protein